MSGGLLLTDAQLSYIKPSESLPLSLWIISWLTGILDWSFLNSGGYILSLLCSSISLCKLVSTEPWTLRTAGVRDRAVKSLGFSPEEAALSDLGAGPGWDYLQLWLLSVLIVFLLELSLCPSLTLLGKPHPSKFLLHEYWPDASEDSSLDDSEVQVGVWVHEDERQWVFSYKAPSSD